jgi:hypothetical protein
MINKIEVPTVVFSIFLVFFQYVKERFYYALKIMRHNLHRNCVAIVENNGFEPLTPCVQGRCSSQLS